MATLAAVGVTAISPSARRRLGRQLLPLPPPLPYAVNGASLKLFPLAAPCSSLRRAVHAYIGALRWQPTLQAQAGITWIELLILFERFGGASHFAANTPGVRKAASLRKRLQVFKRAVRHVVKHNLAVDQQQLFHQNTCLRSRLQPFGFHGSIPAIRCLPVLTAEDSTALSAAVVSLHGRALARRYLSGAAVAVQPRPLRIHGVPPWTPSLKLRALDAIASPPVPTGPLFHLHEAAALPSNRPACMCILRRETAVRRRRPVNR